MKKIINFIIWIILLYFILATLNYLLKNYKVTSNIESPKVILTNSWWIKIE